MALSSGIDHCQFAIANWFASKDGQTCCETIGNGLASAVFSRRMSWAGKLFVSFVNSGL
jgi:hypothetical protein